MKKLETKNKEAIYLAPDIPVWEISSEGIVCASGGDVDPNNPFSGATEDSWTFFF